MAEAEVKHLVTANRLRDGIPVYFAGGESWTPSIEEAALVEASEAEALLQSASAAPVANPVVAPYLIEAKLEQGQVTPLSLRERIRATGPTA